MTTHATITDALRALPVGPDSIAAHLADMGVQGECSTPRRCAIAEYLHAVGAVPAGDSVTVGAVRARIVTSDDEAVYYSGDLGRSDISAFVAAFDRREYPELIAPALVAA